MHGLPAINRLNFEAFAASIANFQAQGRWVVATYDGLHLIGIETFATHKEADAVTFTPAAPGISYRVFPPTN